MQLLSPHEDLYAYVRNVLQSSERGIFDLTDMELYFMFVLAGPQAAMQVFSLHSTGTQQVTRDQIVSQQSHLSAIRVNLTVRFNFFDVKSGVPFLEFTEQSLIYQ